MKKAFLYVFAAVVSGVGIMLFPLWTFFMSYGESPVADGIPYPKVMQASEHWPEFWQTRTEGDPLTSGDYTGQTQPTDAGMQMLIIGFIVAMVVYLIVRRRVHRPTYLPMYGTWRP